MRREIKYYYHDKVELNYIDVEDDDLTAFPNVQAVLSEQKPPLPLIAFEDAPLWSGKVSFPQIVAELNRRDIKFNQR